MEHSIDREKVIEEFEHLLNAAKGNYQDFVDLTVDGGEEILALLKEQETDAGIMQRCRDGSTVKYLGKGVVVLNYQWWADLLKKRGEFPPVPTKEELLIEQEAVIRCKDCKHYRYYGLSEETVSECTIDHCENPDENWFCADGKRNGDW